MAILSELTPISGRDSSTSARSGLFVRRHSTRELDRLQPLLLRQRRGHSSLGDPHHQADVTGVIGNGSRDEALADRVVDDRWLRHEHRVAEAEELQECLLTPLGGGQCRLGQCANAKAGGLHDLLGSGGDRDTIAADTFKPSGRLQDLCSLGDGRLRRCRPGRPLRGKASLNPRDTSSRSDLLGRHGVEHGIDWPVCTIRGGAGSTGGNHQSCRQSSGYAERGPTHTTTGHEILQGVFSDAQQRPRPSRRSHGIARNVPGPAPTSGNPCQYWIHWLAIQSGHGLASTGGRGFSAR